MPRTPVNLKQIGSSGLNRYGPYIYEDFLPELRWPRAAKVYQEMADNDPVIGAILYLAEMLIRGTTWTVVPASDNAKDTELAKFIDSCMHDMDMSWANTICEILSMLTYGFSFHEIVYKIRRGPLETNNKYKSKYSDAKIGWRRLPVRSQATLHSWEFNEEGDVTGFVQMPPEMQGTVTIPMSKGLLFRTRISRDNPEGKSLLRNAYRPWFFKKHFEEIEGIGIERDLAGFPVLTAPPEMDLWNDEIPEMAALRGRAEELVASIRRDSQEGVLLPNGWALELLSSGSSRQIDIGGTIERYDNRIAITMLSDIILIGGNSTGSFALADTKQSMLAAALQAQLFNIADVFNNTAIPQLLQINNMQAEELPKIVPGQIQTPSLKEMALVLRAMGIDINGDMKLMNYVRHITGMPELDKKEFDEIYRKPLEESRKPKEIAPADGTKPVDGTDIGDTTDNELEESDMAYTGGER